MTVKYPLHKSDIPHFKEQAYILKVVFMDIYQTKISNFAILDAYAKALGYANASTLSIDAGSSKNTGSLNRISPLLHDKSIIEKTIDALQLDESSAQKMEHSQLFDKAFPHVKIIQGEEVNKFCTRRERVVLHPIFMKYLREQTRELINEHSKANNTLEPERYKEADNDNNDRVDELLYEEEGDRNSLLVLNGYRYYHLDRTYSSRSFVVENLELGFRRITPKSVDRFIEIEHGRYAVADSDCYIITLDWLYTRDAEIFSKHFNVMITPHECAFIERIH